MRVVQRLGNRDLLEVTRGARPARPWPPSRCAMAWTGDGWRAAKAAWRIKAMELAAESEFHPRPVAA